MVRDGAPRLLTMTEGGDGIKKAVILRSRQSRRLEGRTEMSSVFEPGAYLYILLCADGSYYVGTTIGSLDRRIAEHQVGAFGGYTSSRRPVRLVYHQHFVRLDDAAAAERQVKGWRRDKKEALIRGDFTLLPALSKRGVKAGASIGASFETRPDGRSSG
jgi:putative endonuclease